MQFTTLSLFLLGFSLEVAANSGWGATCNSHYLFAPNSNVPNHTLTANCRKPNGVYNVTTGLNLNKCFGNSNGNLVAQLNGGLGASCRNVNIGYSGTVITAECGDGKGGWRQTSIESNNYIGNQNGGLFCFNTR